MTTPKLLHSQIGKCSHVSTKATSMLEETKRVFKRPDAFLEIEKKYTPAVDGGLARPDLESSTAMTTTVVSRLEWLFEHFGEFLDAESSREATNQVAKGDLTFAGRTYRLPVTTLLGLEKQLKTHLRPVLLDLPTNDSLIPWVIDEATGTWVSPPTQKFVVDKVTKFDQFNDPTGKHPPQIQKHEVSERQGTLTTRTHSGMYSSHQKADLLRRTDELIELVIAARHEANNTEVLEVPIAKALFQYLLHGTAS